MITATRPEVTAFLDAVRDQLADLDHEQREELLDGLEADLSEQLAAGDALPDPVAYAAELRAAAGLPARRHALRLRLDATAFDEARALWARATDRSDATRRAWEVAVAVRPAWWVLRAWIAVTLLDQALGPWEYVGLWPTLRVPLLGPALLLVAVVVSVLVGQGRLWPGSGPDRPLGARLALLGLNVLAVLAPLTFTGDGSGVTAYAAPVSVRHAGDPALRSGGDVVRNIYAYDAQGQPLRGVQLFDQEGRPVEVAPQSSMGRGRDRQVTCPWFNGTTALRNVYPLPQRAQARGTCGDGVERRGAGEQALPAPPLAQLPPVTTPAWPGTVVAPQG